MSKIPRLSGKAYEAAISNINNLKNKFEFGPTPTPGKTPLDILEVYKRPVTFTFVDAVAHVVLPFQLTNKTPLVPLKGLSVLALSEHVDTYPVTSLGQKGLNGFTRGHALTAGSLGFTIFDRDPWWEVITLYDEWINNSIDKSITRPHNLPPFDLLINFVNDAGDLAEITIRSVVLVDGSQSMGVDTIKMTQAYSFICKGATTFASTTMKEDLFQPSPYFGFEGIGKKVKENPTGLGTDIVDMRYSQYTDPRERASATIRNAPTPSV